MSLLGRLMSRKPAPAPALTRESLATWVREGYHLQASGQSQEALRLFHQVLERDARCADALYFLGCSALTDGRELEAVDFFEKAVEARPKDAAFHFVLGGTLYDLGRFEEAARWFKSGVQLQPENADMAGNLWMAMLEAGRDEEARIAAERARADGLNNPQLELTLAGIYRDHGRIEESIAAYRRALDSKPDDFSSYSNLLFTLNYSERDAAAIYAEHRNFAMRFARPYVAPPPERTWPRRLRIGYVSPDFCAHVVAFFVEPILEHADREKFEVFCYYNHRVDDHFTARLRALADHWLDCVHLSDAQLADRIRADRIDILVDLAGHTARNRLSVFAMKPAPVQVTYLGYPNTTGLAAIDYRITDARADPPGAADRVSAERLVRLPDCFHCYRPMPACPDVAPPPALASSHVTFGCFNNFTKLSPGFMSAASKVLAAVPASRLFLKAKTLGVPSVAERVRGQLAGLGVDLARVDLVGQLPTFADHLAAYKSVDIALDSFPYHGTTTTMEALWMGVPVVTLAGDRHASRVGVSLLGAVGLHELIAHDVDEYVALCASLAADRGRLAELRASLRERVRRSPLTDEVRFVRTLERSFIEMWEQRLKQTASLGDVAAGSLGELLAQASQLRREGRLAEASEAYERILQSAPDHPDALAAIWDNSFDAGNPGAAVDWLNRAISVRGDVPSFHYMLGCSLQAQGKVHDAIESFARALALDPGYAKAHNNLGCSLEAAGRLGEALQAYGRATELDPKLAVAFFNLGNAYRQFGNVVESIEWVGRALALEPAHADWQCNRSDGLYDRLRLDEAVAGYRKALELDPRYARAHSGLGLALQALGRVDEAVASFRRALELDPDSSAARSCLLLALHYRQAEERELLLDEHLKWERRHARGIGWQAARTKEERGEQRRLRIGYLSADFQRHPVSHFVEPVLAAHDRSKVHVFGYSNVPFADDVTRRIEGLCEDWRDISRLGDIEVAERMRYDAIDILVDLSGHSGGGRLQLLARKPAPVQVTWLGYPDTTGLRALDYRLTDALADPPGDSEPFCVEKLVRLPTGFLCYLPPADSPVIAEAPSLNARGVTFGCFNALPKITPSMIAVWSNLLRALPDAKLILKAYGLSADSARRGLIAQFEGCGIDSDRIALLPPDNSMTAHLARYNEIDVALDVYPYNGTTTTCEALWMGVPVVTLAGTSHVSRVGASLLARTGLADLVARTEDEYLAKARALAADLQRRRAWRASARQDLQASPLLDAPAFSRALEAAYLNMWNTYAHAADAG